MSTTSPLAMPSPRCCRSHWIPCRNSASQLATTTQTKGRAQARRSRWLPRVARTTCMGRCSNITNLDPLLQGPNTALLNSYFVPTYGAFAPNDSSVGDGLNYSGFRFRAPTSLNNNAFIAKVDYHLTADGKHTLFVRGALQNI